jgi:hypothetical protein
MAPDGTTHGSPKTSGNPGTPKEVTANPNALIGATTQLPYPSVNPLPDTGPHVEFPMFIQPGIQMHSLSHDGGNGGGQAIRSVELSGARYEHWQ